MKKLVIPFLLTLLIVTLGASPAFAHGGEETAASTGVSPNVILFGIAFLLTPVAVVVGQRLSDQVWTKWQYGVVGLGAIGGFIHLGLGIRGDLLLFLNGLGYLAFLAMLFFPIQFLIERRQALRWALIGYTAVTIIGYFLSHGLGEYDRLGLLTKALELGLIAYLIMRIYEVKRIGTNLPSVKSFQMNSEFGGD
jgi:hypothetical protein